MGRHEHGTPSKGTKGYQCPNCQKTFVEPLDTIYYHRHIDAEEIHWVLRSHREGVSQGGIAGLTGLAYNTMVSIIREASQRGQILHNQEVTAVDTAEVSSDEPKKTSIALHSNLLRLSITDVILLL